MWYCFLQSGIHATLSGVLLGFAIPFDKHDNDNISYQLQHFLHKPVAYIIVPIFALVNTAIILPSNFFAAIATSNSLGIISGLFIGKLLGIIGVTWVLVKTGVAQLQQEIKWKALIGVGFLGGIGFTMSMFISNLAFDNNELNITSKLSILIASTLSAITGLIIVKKSYKV